MLSSLKDRWQVIVVGAGPAGSAAAITAARLGMEVLLVDAKTFPRRKVCGGCLNRVSLDLVTQLLGTGVSGTGHPLWDSAIPLHNFHMTHRHRQFSFATPQGLAVERSQLDAQMVQVAQKAGVVFMSPVSATVGDLCRESQSRQVVLSSQGEKKVVDAAAVVLASGLNHRSAVDIHELQQVSAVSSRVGIEAIFDQFPANYQPQAIHMVVGTHGYVGLTQIADGRLHVAAAVDRLPLQQYGPAKLTQVILAKAGACPLDEDAAVTWRGTPPLTARARRVAVERVFLVGDAAGYVEPFTGEGIRWALESGIGVAAFVQQSQGKLDLGVVSAWESWHRCNIRPQQKLCQQISWGLRRPTVRWLAHQLLRWSPSFAETVIGRLNRDGRS